MLTLPCLAYFASKCQDVPTAKLTHRHPPNGGVVIRGLRGSVQLRNLNFRVPNWIDNLLKTRTYQARMSLRRALANPSSA
jgi:hypothetical protein